jgi:hypothetical protein
VTDHPAKAEIRTVEQTPGNPIPCMFNPKEYSFAKKNTWTKKLAKGSNVPEFEFGGGDPATLTLQLLFDTYETGEDVRKKYTDQVWQLMMIDETLKDHTSGKGRPPKVRFQWGQAWSFDAVITSITQKFTLFKEDGMPVRATLDVGFQQVVDQLYYPGQNPTSGGIGGGREWIVREGDTLSAIAYAEYGDSTRWRSIAEANGLVQVRRLRTGMSLEIPNLG